MNLFLCCLTHPAPTNNHQGEAEGHRTPLQKLTVGEHEHAVISSESLRYALREVLRGYGLPCNRRRERNQPQLSVSYQDFPDPERFIDDFLFGYVVTQRDQIPESLRQGFVYKRDSIVRNNLALAVEPFRYETLLSQGPHIVGRDEQAAPWTNTKSAVLLRREVVFTRFQYPIALHLGDFELEPDRPHAFRNEWFAALLRAVSELHEVAGNHTLSYYPMAAASAVARLTPRLTPGFPLYPFASNGLPEPVLEAVRRGAVRGEEVHLAGELAAGLSSEAVADLKGRGVEFHASVADMLGGFTRRLAGRPLFAEG